MGYNFSRRFSGFGIRRMGFGASISQSYQSLAFITFRIIVQWNSYGSGQFLRESVRLPVVDFLATFPISSWHGRQENHDA
jgi:hypothetical protein